MIATDANALKCDLAETYGIYNMKSLPASQVAIFSIGLRNDSRIKMALRGDRITYDQFLLALLNDRIALLMYGLGMAKELPYMITEHLDDDKKISAYTQFDSGADFEARRKEIIEGNK